MFQWIKTAQKVIERTYSHLDSLCSLEYFYILMVYSVASLHIVLVLGNILSMALLVVYEPLYVWLPIVTLLSSPIVGGSHCWMNRLENVLRERANMPLITDRLESLLKR